MVHGLAGSNWNPRDGSPLSELLADHDYPIRSMVEFDYDTDTVFQSPDYFENLSRSPLNEISIKLLECISRTRDVRTYGDTGRAYPLINIGDDRFYSNSYYCTRFRWDDSKRSASFIHSPHIGVMLILLVSTCRSLYTSIPPNRDLCKAIGVFP